MANERITPFVKRLRTNGGTFYSFSSSIEDIGLNINERNNIVKFSHFALLDIPDIKSKSIDSDENYFNITAIAGAWEYENPEATSNTKDGRILIAESFQNYALNLENTILNSDNYNPALTSTISERVFWKWLKETGAIRWTRDFSTGYWTEEEDADGTAGYNKVVKYLGEITAGNVRQDAFGTFNETYVLIPTSHGQTRIYFQQQEDDNYQHGLTFQNGTENILGRQSYTKPHPDGLSYRAYYDFVDSSTSTGVYAMTYDPSTGVDIPGWWYSYYGLNPTGDNWYIIDYDDYLDTSIFTQTLEYNGGSGDQIFKRSNVDCISVVKDLDTLKTIFGDTALTYDSTAIEYSINDDFTFNSVLVYYTVYNETGDTVLARNLLGILFLDAPEGNSSQISGDGITIPSLEKIASTVTGFGTSYSFKLNIKTENILDDTAAVIVDESTSSQTPLEEFMDVFYNLERSVEILQKHTGTINYISQQNQNISNIQSQQQELLQQLNEQVQDTAQDITGTSNTLAMFASGSDPLVDSSIYMSLGKIGLFTQTPQYPVEIDASVKTKDIFIENAIRDTSGNILLGYGSPLQINSTEAGRDVSIFGQVNVDGSIYVKGNIDMDGALFFAGIPFDPSATGGGGSSDISFEDGTNIDNRILTSKGDSSIKGEANLTFDGTILNLDGLPLSNSTDRAGLLQIDNDSSSWAGIQTNSGGQRFSFMGEDEVVSIYNDTSDNWILRATAGAEIALYHAGDKIVETSTIGLNVFGDNDPILSVDHNSATGNPYISLRQTGTERAKFQYIDSTDVVRIENETSDEYLEIGNGLNSLIFNYNGTDYTVYHEGNSSNLSFESGTNVDNRILTANGNSSIRGEANLTFDGTELNVNGNTSISGNLYMNGGPMIFPDDNTGLITFKSTSGTDHRLFLSSDTLLFQPNSSGSVGEVNFSTGAWKFNSLSTTSGGISSDTYVIASTYLRSTGGSTTTPGLQLGDSDYGLFASGTSYMGVMSNNAEVARFYGTGDFHADGDVIANSSSISDIRLKENIEPLNDSISKIKKLDGKSFNFKGKDEKQFGFIAQEVEKVFPEIVKENELIGKEDKYKTIRYQEVIPHLVEAIKEQQEMIETLKKEIEELKKR